jgi:LCP family protein required for cell wall assembly
VDRAGDDGAPASDAGPGGPSDLTGAVAASGGAGAGAGAGGTGGAGAASPGGGDSGADLLAAMGAGAAAGGADLGTVMTRKERREARTGTPAKAKRTKNKRTWLDWVLLTGVVIVSLTLIGVTTGYIYVQYRFHQVTKVTVHHLKVVPPGAPFNVLLIGSDSRAGFTPADVAAYGSEATAGGQRSDVVKIVHVVPATGQISVLSIPRDTMVAVAGDTSETGTYNRINSTYVNGPDQLVQTIEANFGIPIEHVVQLNFLGFRGAVDAIGGVYLDFPYPARDQYTGLDITTTGCQHVNGGYALAVARSRHYEYYQDGEWMYDGTSDFGRIQRQNAFLKALINQAEKQYNPLTLNAFIGSVVQGVTIDSTFTISELVQLAQEFRDFASSNLATATLPTYAQESSEFASLGSVLYVQQPQADQVISEFLGGPVPEAKTPPPDPYGGEETTTTTEPSSSTYSGGGSTSSTSATSVTTTTIDTSFDPTPCQP